MHLVQLLRARLLLARPSDLRMQFHSRYRESAFRIFFHMADRLVRVVIKDKLLLTRDCEKGEHVATGKRSNESFFGIDIGRIAKISGRSRSRHSVAAVEAPAMIARIFLINKFGPAALPTQSYFVFGHTFRIRRASEDRKQPGVIEIPGQSGIGYRRFGPKPRPATAATEGSRKFALYVPPVSFRQIRRSRRTLHPIHVPWAVDCDER
jgi:hypothetical protein